jgi:hypothetical protein
MQHLSACFLSRERVETSEAEYENTVGHVHHRPSRRELRNSVSGRNLGEFREVGACRVVITYGYSIENVAKHNQWLMDAETFKDAVPQIHIDHDNIRPQLFYDRA